MNQQLVKAKAYQKHQKTRGLVEDEFTRSDSEIEALNQAEEEEAVLVLEKNIETYDPESNLEGEYFFLNESPDLISSLIKAFCDDEKQIELL